MLKSCHNIVDPWCFKEATSLNCTIHQAGFNDILNEKCYIQLKYSVVLKEHSLQGSVYYSPSEIMVDGNMDYYVFRDNRNILCRRPMKEKYAPALQRPCRWGAEGSPETYILMGRS